MSGWIVPDWPAAGNVKALFTTRNGGVGSAPYDSLNLGDHVGDDPLIVRQNRALLRRLVPNEPCWLKQVHGTHSLSIDDGNCAVRQGDAAFSRRPGNICAVLVADCLPVLLCDRAGTVVGVIHAGWRGMAEGVIECAVSAIGAAGNPVIAWLGPAIGPNHFEVGDEVREAFISHHKQAGAAFLPCNSRDDGKWLADLFLLARQRLAQAGVHEVFGGGKCTYSDPARFFSYRRDGNTGRMAGLIWLAQA
ncbi:MAG: peptidoglycan editing factor PgeF [Nitrosospira sp.]|nr:peptidoglycan editing factor PgeF [Nitrosospira sp.]